MAGILLVTIALVTTLFVSGKEKDRAFQCLENLRRLSMAMRSSNLGLADPGWDKMPLGSKFWAAYPDWPAADSRTSPLTDKMLTCPYVEKEGKHIDYQRRPTSTSASTWWLVTPALGEQPRETSWLGEDLLQPLEYVGLRSLASMS